MMQAFFQILGFNKTKPAAPSTPAESAPKSSLIRSPRAQSNLTQYFWSNIYPENMDEKVEAKNMTDLAPAAPPSFGFSGRR